MKRKPDRNALKNAFRKLKWRRLYTVTACVAVFITTYMLILPALTLETNLVCGKEEHTHTAACYTTEKVLVCESEESEEHTHTDECYETKKVLTCEKEEHVHTDECYETEESGDATADVEKASDWEKTLEDVKLSGDWASDVVAIAKTQLGYKESAKNFEVDEDGDKSGYTRYGAWYGNTYGDWSAMYVSFCIHYAEVDKDAFPLTDDCSEWITLLKNKEEKLNAGKDADERITLYQKAGDHTPESGDLIFFNCGDNEGKNGISDSHVGIVVHVDQANNKIKTIEGDADNKVAYQEYSLDDETITGYGILPANPDLEEADQEAEEEETSAESADENETAQENETADETETADAEESAAETVNETGKDNGLVKTCEGSDYTITVTYTEEAGIPEDAELKAEEYEKDSDSYKACYEEAAVLYGWEEDTDYSEDFRLFDIGFYDGKEEIEPECEVQVNITYKDVELEEDVSCQVAHYGDDGNQAEIINTETTIAGDDASIDFTAESFSAYSTWITSEDAINTAEGSGNLIASFSFANGSFTDSTGNANAATNGGCSVKQNNNASAGGSDRYACYFDGTDDYLNITKADGTSLLTDYTEVSFDFWMYSTSNNKNSWPFYAAPNSNAQSSPENYIGSFVNNNTFNVERYLHGRTYYGAGTTNASSNNIYNNLVHVRVDYTATNIILHVWNQNGEQLVASTKSASASLRAILGSNSVLQIGKANWGNGEYFTGYIDELKIYGRTTETTTLHPACAMPGTVDKNSQLFYSLDGNGSSINGVEGVVYGVYDSDGKEVMTVTTTDSYQVDLGTMDSGTYTVKQISVPDGYVVNPEVKSFTVEAGTYTNIGIFYVYKAKVPGYEEDKNAQVVDYINRTYNVELTAASGAYKYNFETKNYTLVVDQSNSMLFPAELTTFAENVHLDASGSYNNYGQTVKNSKSLENCGMKKDKVYYLITDEDKTSTVWALYYDSSNDGGWCFQDASYYAKAQLAEIGGYSNIALEKGVYVSYAVAGESYSSAYGVGGGDVDKGLGGTLVTGNYTIYEGSTYNRLHDLQQAITLFAEQLASLSPDSTMDIVTFDSDVEKCYSDIKLNQAGVNEIIDIVNQIATKGGTRQDLGLSHVVGNYGGLNTANHTTNHLESGTKDDNIVILVTDGAPVNAGSGTPYEIVNPSATEVKKYATLMTIGLSTSKVKGGSDMLSDIATETDLNTSNDSGKWFFDAKKAGDLAKIMIENILFKTATKELLADTATIKDVISDSFYPIDPDNNEPLTDGTKIALDGTVDVNGPGTVHYDSEKKQWYVTWEKQNLSITATTVTTGTDTTSYIWKPTRQTLSKDGTYYILYKEYENGNPETVLSEFPSSWFTYETEIGKVTYSNGIWKVDWYNCQWNGPGGWMWAPCDYRSSADVSSYVQTTTTSASTTTTYEKDIWSGHVYLKAKEDFIGGNSIDTNASAEVDVLDSSGKVRDAVMLETPNVNVRLLPLNQVNSEETVFLGDEVSIQDKIKALESQLYFSKISDYVTAAEADQSIEAEANKTASTVSTEDGAEIDKFYLKYAIGRDLTTDEWTSLFNGGTVTIPYTFDEASSHGAVGEFTITLTKTGDAADMADASHATTATGKEVEKYTLSVNYTAYPIATEEDEGDDTRPANAHNYGSGPGTEVGGSEAGTTVETGLGTLTSTNIHRVHVVDGKLTVVKKLDEKIVKPAGSSNDQHFTFTVQKLTGSGADASWTDLLDSSGNKRTVTVTVAGGSDTGTAFIEHIPRGTYKLVEDEYDDTTMSGMTIITDQTNCQSNTISSTEVTFTIGTDTDGNDVITWNTGSGYQAVYSYLSAKPTISSDADCRNVSYGAAEVTNVKRIWEAEIPVTKVWDSAVPAGDYTDVYVVLCQNGSVVYKKDKNNVDQAQVLKLSADNSWTGSFTVALSRRGEDVSTLGYSVRELSDVRTEDIDSLSGFTTAVVVNSEDSENPDVIAYKEAKDSGVVAYGSKGFEVAVTTKTTETSGGKMFEVTVTNKPTYTLPMSGGIGTYRYTLGGAAIFCIGLLYGFYLRRKRERRSY